jgi:hypothetical protein
VGTSRLQAIGILTLEPERLKNRSTYYRRRSSGLRLQFVDVEVFSFLPQCPVGGNDLSLKEATA